MAEVTPVMGEEQVQDIPKNDETIDIVKDDIKSAIDYVRDNEAEDWANWWKLYNNERIPSMVGYHGQADTFDPMTFNNVETNVANVLGAKPRTIYLPTTPEQASDTKLLTQLYDYTWDRNNFSEGVIPFGREWFVTGNATIWMDWHEGWVRWRHIPIEDVILQPVRNPADLGYGGYRELVNLDELKAIEVYDADKKSWVKKYDVEGVRAWSGDPKEDEGLADCYRGFNGDNESKKNTAELIRLYYTKGALKGKMIEVLNRTHLAYESDSPFQREEIEKTVKVAVRDDEMQPVKDEKDQPTFEEQKVKLPEICAFIPFAFQRDYVDPKKLYAKGEVAPNAGTQETLNDTINQKRDNFTFNLNNMMFIDPKYAVWKDKIKNIPNAIYPIPADAIKEMPKQDMTQGADVEIARLKQTGRETAAIDEVVVGIKPDQQATATQVNAQMAQAGKRFSIKLQMLENGAFKDLAEKTFLLIQLFLDEEKLIRVMGKKGIEWLKFNPDMYWGTYETRVQLEANAKADRDAEVQRLEVAGQFMVGNPFVDQRESTKVLLQKLLQYEDDEIDALMVKQASDEAAIDPATGMPMGGAVDPATGMPMAPPDAGKPEKDPTQEFITKNFDKLPEDAKHAILQSMGIPSEMLSPTGTKQAADHTSTELARTAQAHSQALDLNQNGVPDVEESASDNGSEHVIDTDGDGDIDENDLSISELMALSHSGEVPLE